MSISRFLAVFEPKIMLSFFLFSDHIFAFLQAFYFPDAIILFNLYIFFKLLILAINYEKSKLLSKERKLIFGE
jgi:hypothetical protein